MTSAEVEALVRACREGDTLAFSALTDLAQEQRISMRWLAWNILLKPYNDNHIDISDGRPEIAQLLIYLLARDWRRFWAQCALIREQPNSKPIKLWSCGSALWAVEVNQITQERASVFRFEDHIVLACHVWMLAGMPSLTAMDETLPFVKRLALAGMEPHLIPETEQSWLAAFTGHARMTLRPPEERKPSETHVETHS